MGSASQQFFYRLNGRNLGPISADDLRRLAAVGQITPETQIARSQDGPWRQAYEVKGLEFPAESPPPPGKPTAAAATAGDASIEQMLQTLIKINAEQLQSQKKSEGRVRSIRWDVFVIACAAVLWTVLFCGGVLLTLLGIGGVASGL